MNNYINGELFLLGTQSFLKIFIGMRFIGGFLIFIIIVLIIKYLWSWIIKKIVKLLETNKKNRIIKILYVLGAFKEDFKNVFLGLLGMFFSWTIVSTSLIIIPFGLHRSITEQIILKPEQIIFAQKIAELFNYSGLAVVILVFLSFAMLACSFMGGIFKTTAKVTGVLSILLYAALLLIGNYISLVLQ